MTTPIGWYVRIWIGEEACDDPAYDTALYIVGCPSAAEAEAAVRIARFESDERMEVLDSIIPGIRRSSGRAKSNG